jgi:hypothetical protein
VVTVNDHFPHKLNDAVLPTLPVRALTRYAIEHEASSYDLKWGDGIAVEHERAVRNGWPFITHLAEGFDDEAMDGVAILEKNGALDRHGLFVHCIAFSAEDIEKTARAGASIAWCPVSNMFMFNTTAKIRQFIRAGINVTLGSDSSHTGSANLLAEIASARKIYRQLYGEDIGAEQLFKMVTINAAKAFWMDGETGSLSEGKRADLMVLRGHHGDPYENLASASMEDIRLLTMDGEALYGEELFAPLLPPHTGVLPAGYSTVRVGGTNRFVKGDPAALYNRIRNKLGFKKEIDFLPFEPEV